MAPFICADALRRSTMAKKTTPLRLVTEPASMPVPPRPLSKHGATLWESIHAEYRIDDSGGFETLAQACQALDRAEECAAIVARDGAVIDTERGPKEHPLLKMELANRAFVVRTLQKLGLNFEPVRAGPGAPTRYG
jgi:hypothetical protein